MGNESKQLHIKRLGSIIAALNWAEPTERCPVHIFKNDSKQGPFEEVTELSPEHPILWEPEVLPKVPSPLTSSGIDDVEKLSVLEESRQPNPPFEYDEEIASRQLLEAGRCYIGYDVEWYQPNQADHLTATLLSHQFYIAHNGKRKCAIILTEERFKESTLLEFIARCLEPLAPHSQLIQANLDADDPSKPLPETLDPEKADAAEERVPLKTIYLASHFSLAEGGWLLESFQKPKEYLHDLKFLDDIHKNPYACYYAIAEYAIIKLIISSIFSNAGKKVDFTFTDEAKFVDCSATLDHQQNYPWIEDATIKKVLDYNKASLALNAARSGELELIQVELYTKIFLKRVHQHALPLIPKRDRTWHGMRRLTTAAVLAEYRKMAIRKLCNRIQKVFKANPDLYDFAVPAHEPSDGPPPFKVVQSAYLNSVLALHKERHQKSLSNSKAVRNSLLDLNSSGRKKPRKNDGAKCPYLLQTQSIRFVDTLGLQAGSLSSLGETIGIDKIELGSGQISDMQSLLNADPYAFCRYAIRDSVVAAEAVAWFGRLFRLELKLPLKTKITAYSSAYFQRVLKKRVYHELIAAAKAKTAAAKEAAKAAGRNRATVPPDLGENLKLYLGWERQASKWVPSRKMEHFARFYNGGWNAVFMPGSRGCCTYWDLKSAYPCSFLMLRHDYNFSKHRIFYGSDAAKRAAELVATNDPFQIAGIEMNFRFKDDVEPIFPTRALSSDQSPLQTYEGKDMILYAREGHANVLFPEYYTAVTMGLLDLENTTISILEEFEPLPGPSKFAVEMKSILEKRGKIGRKTIYKNLANFLYGKLAESIRKKPIKTPSGIGDQRRRPGALTSFALAAYATSCCRAAMGQLLNDNMCFAITTDGFVSPATTLEELKLGEIIQKTQAQIGDLVDEKTGNKYQFIEPAYTAKESLFIKTRGYILDGEDADKKPFVKMAKMGVQTNPEVRDDEPKTEAEVKEFIKILNEKKFNKMSFQRFSALKVNPTTQKHADNPPLKKMSESSVNISYDFKRIPYGPVSLVQFKFSDAVIWIPTFNTKPLLSTSQFLPLRKSLPRNATVQAYRKFITRNECTASDTYQEWEEDQAEKLALAAAAAAAADAMGAAAAENSLNAAALQPAVPVEDADEEANYDIEELEMETQFDDDEDENDDADFDPIDGVDDDVADD